MTNKVVMERMMKGLEVMNTIKRKKLEYHENIMRNERKYHLLKSVFQRRVYDSRPPGRKRISWLEATVNKVIISRMTAKIRHE